MNKIGKMLCYFGFHDWWFVPAGHKFWEWSIYTIAGCDDYRCIRCEKQIHRLYHEHPHEHKEPTRKVLK